MKTTIAYKDAMKFCHHHLGKGCFAPHTGQDMQAWIAFVYLLEMYARGDDRGRAAAIKAMRILVTEGTQDSYAIHETLCQAIPAVLDWTDVHKIWPQLGSRHDVYATERWTELRGDGGSTPRIKRYAAGSGWTVAE